MAVNLLIVPLRDDLPFYGFNITLTGVTYNLVLAFNGRMNRWIMNVNDSSGNQILSGVPVLILRNLTGQYRTLAVPAGIFFAADNTGQDTQPTEFSFGNSNTMYYVDPGT